MGNKYENLQSLDIQIIKGLYHIDYMGNEYENSQSLDIQIIKGLYHIDYMGNEYDYSSVGLESKQEIT